MQGERIQLNKANESWLFLRLGEEQRAEDAKTERLVDYWEIGIGNPDTMLETEADHIANSEIETESELLASLYAELDQYRYHRTSLITLRQSDVSHLRRLLAKRPESDGSLRGFMHLDITSLLDEYFDCSPAEFGLDHSELARPRLTEPDHDEVVTAGSMKQIWEFWSDNFRLVPAHRLEGEPL